MLSPLGQARQALLPPLPPPPPLLLPVFPPLLLLLLLDAAVVFGGGGGVVEGGRTEVGAGVVGAAEERTDELLGRGLQRLESGARRFFAIAA